ncbi:hypothetical protein [Streptomyces viridosporus]|uniref:hypothetical protein n=1 Tax=Streptomyces viridosporus TaxID=67581 RepID=UPI0036FD49AA
MTTPLEELRKASGYRHGIAAQLAREHGGSERGWQRAVAEARMLYEHEDGQNQGQGQDVEQEAGSAQTAP